MHLGYSRVTDAGVTELLFLGSIHFRSAALMVAADCCGPELAGIQR